MTPRARRGRPRTRRPGPAGPDARSGSSTAPQGNGNNKHIIILIMIILIMIILIKILMQIITLLLLLGNDLLGVPWAKCMFFKNICSRLRPNSCNLRHYVSTWSATCHSNFVNYMNLAEQRTLGIEPGTSCIRGPIFTN